MISRVDVLLLLMYLIEISDVFVAINGGGLLIDKLFIIFKTFYRY